MSASLNEADIIRGLDDIYAEFGVAATLTTSGAPTYNPATGTVTPGTEPELVDVTAILGKREQQIEGGAKVTVSTIKARTAMKEGDLIQIGSRKFSVVLVNEKMPFGNILEWIADVEGAAQ